MGLIEVSTALFAGATGVPQYFEQKKAATEARQKQEAANRVSQASAQVENARRRRQAIAQARMASAQNVAAQGSQVQSSSALSGVQAGLGTQLGANIGAQGQRIAAGQDIQNLQQGAANALQKGKERTAMWNAAGNIGQMIGSFGLSSAGGLSGGTGGATNPNPYSEQFLPSNF